MIAGATPYPARTARILHRSLLAGLSIISAVFLFLAFGSDTSSFQLDGDAVVMIGYLMAACAIVPVVFAWFILRPRIPSPSSEQDNDTYWQQALPLVVSFWAAVEGAGIVGAVGALLTGQLAPIFVVAVALAVLSIAGPRHFENR